MEQTQTNMTIQFGVDRGIFVPACPNVIIGKLPNLPVIYLLYIIYSIFNTNIPTFIT